MTKQPSSWSVPIVVALIGVFGTCITAFFTVPEVRSWVGRFFSPSDPKALAIESIPQYIFAYDGRAENLGGFAELLIAYNEEIEHPYYVLDYNLPAGQPGYAGVAFQFNKSQNVSAYKTIEFSIQFQGAKVPIDLFMRDSSGKKSSLRIVSTGVDEMHLKYDLELFKDVDFNALKEVGFNSDDTFSAGDHTVTVHTVRFVR